MAFVVRAGRHGVGPVHSPPRSRLRIRRGIQAVWRVSFREPVLDGVTEREGGQPICRRRSGPDPPASSRGVRARHRPTEARFRSAPVVVLRRALETGWMVVVLPGCRAREDARRNASYLGMGVLSGSIPPRSMQPRAPRGYRLLAGSRRSPSGTGEQSDCVQSPLPLRSSGPAVPACRRGVHRQSGGTVPRARTVIGHVFPPGTSIWPVSALAFSRIRL